MTTVPMKVRNRSRQMGDVQIRHNSRTGPGPSGANGRRMREDSRKTKPPRKLADVFSRSSEVA